MPTFDNEACEIYLHHQSRTHFLVMLSTRCPKKCWITILWTEFFSGTPCIVKIWIYRNIWWWLVLLLLLLNLELKCLIGEWCLGQILWTHYRSSSSDSWHWAHGYNFNYKCNMFSWLWVIGLVSTCYHLLLNSTINPVAIYIEYWWLIYFFVYPYLNCNPPRRYYLTDWYNRESKARI